MVWTIESKEEFQIELRSIHSNSELESAYRRAYFWNSQAKHVAIGEITD